MTQDLFHLDGYVAVVTGSTKGIGKQLIAGATMLERVAEATEIVGPGLYLASDASSFVTGDDLSVSGGMVK